MLEPEGRQGRRADRRGGRRPRTCSPRAKAWVLAATDADIVKPWDAKGYKLPGGAPYHPAGFMTFVGASAMVHGKTQGVYPAAKAMLSAIYEGALVPFDTALRIEARWFTRVLMNPSSAAMIRSLFLNKQALEKGAARPAAARPEREAARRARRRHDGGGHRLCRGERRDRGGADRPRPGGRRPRPRPCRGPPRRGREAQEDHRGREGDAVLAPHRRPRPTTRALAGCDLVVEAVFEDPARQGRGHAPRPRRTCPATRSSPPTPRPCRSASSPGPPRARSSFIGIHFFSPVRPDDAGRDHPRPGDRRPGGGQGARLRAADPQDPDRGQRRALLLRQPLHHPLHQRGRAHGRRGRRAGADRERRQAARHAARAAAAGRRDLDRPRREDRQGDPGGDGRRLSRDARPTTCCSRWPSCGRLGRKAERRLLRLRRQGQAPGPLAGAAPRSGRRAPSSPTPARCSTGWR